MSFVNEKTCEVRDPSMPRLCCSTTMQVSDLARAHLASRHVVCDRYLSAAHRIPSIHGVATISDQRIADQVIPSTQIRQQRSMRMRGLPWPHTKRSTTRD